MAKLKVVPYTFRLVDGDVRQFDGLQWIYVSAITGALDVSFDGSNFAPIQLKRGYRAPDAEPIGRVYVRNSSGATVTVTILTGNGEVIDNNAGSATTGVQDVNIAGNALASFPVAGVQAQGVAPTANPFMSAAEARATERGAVADGQIARLVCDLVGKLIVLPYANPENFESARSSACSGAGGSQAVLAAAGAGVRHYVTDVLIDNNSATASQWQLLDGATVIAQGEVAANGQAVVNFGVPLRGTANTALNVKQTAAGAVVATVSGYKGA